MNRALALDVPHHLTDGVLRRNRNQDMNMIGKQMPFFNPALLLFCKTPEHLAQIPPQFCVQILPAVFRDENNVILALPTGVT
jgi:hypothetical protein